jgi:hypothetical protein
MLIFYKFCFGLEPQLYVKEVLIILCVVGLYPQGVVLESHFSHYEIPKHIGKTWDLVNTKVC